MNSREILLITLLVIAGFVLSDVLVQNLIFVGSLQRFGIRLGIMAQFLALIYLFFDSRDTARRVRRLERMMMSGRSVQDETNESTSMNKDGSR